MKMLKQTSIALMCIAALTMVSACGNNPKKGKEAKDNGKPAAAETRVVCSDVNLDNYVAAIKSNAGVDFKVPAGWTAVSASGTESSLGRTIVVNFGKQEDAVEQARAFFEQTKEQSRPLFEQAKSGGAEYYIKKWSEFLESSLEDHDAKGVGYWWNYLVGPFEDRTVYFYTDPVEIKFELPAVK